MSDLIILYRNDELLADSNIIVDSIETNNLLINGLGSNPKFISRWVSTNLNSALITPIVMDVLDQYNDMPSEIIKLSSSEIQFLEAGYYLISAFFSVTLSSSSVMINFFINGGLYTQCSISPTDSAGISVFPINVNANDILVISHIRIGSNIQPKNLNNTGSCIVITK